VFNLKILYAVIGCLVVGGIILILCAGLSFYNEFTKSSYVILGSVGLYIFNGAACEYFHTQLFFESDKAVSMRNNLRYSLLDFSFLYAVCGWSVLGSLPSTNQKECPEKQ
jgi:hypothetical protein